MSNAREIVIETVGLSKAFGSVHALNRVDLQIRSGEYFVLLGPSGGGKTTLLRLLGGFARPTEGQVLLHGRDVSDLPPNLRSTSMVFQSYALFPHMTVNKNVGYGLKLKKVAKDEREQTVSRALDMVDLSGYGARMPWELSGGQQQRVQLARALVLESDILLLDEPLAALDERLRKDMCVWLKHLQEKVGITFVHVTHNQEEAMSVADRIALIADGRVVEQGDARSVYRKPNKKFTAAFMGESNFFDGTVLDISQEIASVDLGFARVDVPLTDRTAAVGSELSVSIRSERMRLRLPDHPDDPTCQAFDAIYEEEVYLGLTTRYIVRLPTGQKISVRDMSDLSEPEHFKQGRPVKVTWRTADGRLHLS
jgi:ABC-type Fe3+/spermidine/putrescine transport system ATPase subunit